MSHTPGPWTVETDDGNTPVNSAMAEGCLLIDSENAHVAFVFNDKPEDARLIAAAPDLLAALRRAYSVMCVEGENDLEEWQEVLAEVEAAIEKTGVKL